MFPGKTDWNHFCGGVFIESGNFALQTCKAHICESFREVLKSQNILSFFNTSRKVSAEELSVWY